MRDGFTLQDGSRSLPRSCRQGRLSRTLCHPARLSSCGVCPTLPGTPCCLQNKVRVFWVLDRPPPPRCGLGQRFQRRLPSRHSPTISELRDQTVLVLSAFLLNCHSPLLPEPLCSHLCIIGMRPVTEDLVRVQLPSSHREGREPGAQCPRGSAAPLSPGP